MMSRASGLVFVCVLLLGASEAGAKKFRYAGGPVAPEDTVLSVAEVDLQPIARKRGPRVPATNLQLTSMVANTAFAQALADAPVDSGGRVTLAPAASHPMNFVVEHAILRHLAKRRVIVTVRRTPVPDEPAVAIADSVAEVAPDPTQPVLEYELASARVTYLRLVGWLPGRVRIERQALVEGRLDMRDPRTGQVLWVGDAAYNLLDSFPRGQLALVEDARFGDLRSPPPQRNVDKLVEPVIVVAIVSGLIALFFQNRP